MNKAALLTIVRHGETAANSGGIWHGSIDTPLSERGRQQARRAANYLHEHPDPATTVYASPLQRARHTAEAIAERFDLEVQIVEGLREYDLGDWEGKTYRALLEEHQFWDHIKTDPDFAPHGGESPSEVVTRYGKALEQIAARHPGERVIAVGHGGALSMVFAQLIDGDYTHWGRVMGNCAISELVLTPQPKLLSFDHQDHLAGL